MLTMMNTGLTWLVHEADGEGSGDHLTSSELSTA